MCYFPFPFKPINWVENAYMFFMSHERAFIVSLQNMFALFYYADNETNRIDLLKIRQPRS